MKFRLAALAAALAIAAGVPAKVWAEDEPDGIARLLARLERVVQQGDPGGYSQLLAEAADARGAAQFARAELPAGITGAVVQERDRAEIAGRLQGTAYRLAADVFEQSGPSARIATWRLDVVRRDALDGRVEWAIADQARISSVDDLHRLALDATRRFIATNLTLRDEDLELTLAGGSVFVSEIDAGTTAIVLIGRGRMRFDPGPEAEKTQVRIFADADALDTGFDAAYLRINPADFDRLIPADRIRPAPFDEDDFKKADRIFREDSPRSYALELGDLAREGWSVVPRPGDLVAEIHTRRFDTLTYSRSSASREDISLFDRKARTVIALYASRQRSGLDAEAGGGAAFEVRHYDIDVDATPERPWIQGRTRMTLRVGAQPIQTITLGLAEPLAVQSVVSDEYGRLFSMRVKDESSLVVSLPAVLSSGAQLTLTITYAGRLVPERRDIETFGAALWPPSPQQDPGEVEKPQPSFLYSNQPYWYPRGPGNQFATATLRITVPEGDGCIASGQPEAGPPVAVPETPSTPERQTYVFHARQPLRYFSFVVSRLDAISTTAVDGLQLSVQANPGHASRGRQVAARAADIARFYRSILDDSPYPSLTVALLESDAPGGHSPGYFTMLNEPTPLGSFGRRNDPASFDDFPEYVLAHEVAHQWWGQAVGWRSYHDQWLSEGFSQYFAALYAEREHGDGVFDRMMRDMREWAIDETEAGPISLGSRLGHIQRDSRIFRALVYDKGAIVLHMLRQIVGDEAFFDGLRRFYDASRFRSVGTAELQEAMEAEAGRPLDRFFDGWIDRVALPRLAFSYRVAAGGPGEAGDVVLRFEQTGPLFELPVTVTLQYADGTSADVVVPVAGRIAELRVGLAGPLRRAGISRDAPPLAEVVRP